MVFWEAVEVGPVLAVNKASRAAAEKKRERCFLVFTRWAVGHAILRREVQVYSARPAHRPKNRKKCDETVKKRGELVMGAFFEPKKRGGIAMPPLRSAAAVHGRAANGCSSLPPSIGPGRILLFPDFRPSDSTSWLACLSGHPCRRRGRVKIFHRGPNFYLTHLSPQLGCN